MAKLLIGLGLLLILLGVLSALGALSWFGHLPGDIRSESGRTRFYFPITSMLLISLILTILVNIIRRIF